MSCVLEPRIGMVRKSIALGDVFQHRQAPNQEMTNWTAFQNNLNLSNIFSDQLPQLLQCSVDTSLAFRQSGLKHHDHRKNPTSI